MEVKEDRFLIYFLYVGLDILFLNKEMVIIYLVKK